MNEEIQSSPTQQQADIVNFSTTNDRENQKLREKVLDVLQAITESATPEEYSTFLKDANQEKVGHTSTKHLQVLLVDAITALARKGSFDLARRDGAIYVYNSRYWERISDEKFQNFLGQMAERFGLDPYLSRHYLFREQLLRQFFSQGFAESFADSSVLINLQNGTYEVKQEGHQLREFRKENFIRYQLSFAYDPTATAPIFQRYLDKVLPDKQAQQVLAEYLGYLFVPNAFLKLEKALILYGSGANGKSVFFEIVLALLGAENVCCYSLQSLTDGPGYYRAMLSGKLLNYASEISDRLNPDIFKALVSGEPVEARLPYKDPFTLKDYARMIFNCNSLPKDTEANHAFFRRFLVVPFEVQIPQDEQDPELHRKIVRSELPGIFNFVLQGLDRILQNRRFSVCSKISEAVETYKMESDPVRLFIEEKGLRPSHKGFVYLKILYAEFQIWSGENGFRLMSIRTFADRMRSAGFQTERDSMGTIVYADS